jgi:acyl-CoA hydrolase
VARVERVGRTSLRVRVEVNREDPMNNSRELCTVGYFTMVALERVMNLAEKPHLDADSAISSVHRRSPIFRICKPFLSKFITASSTSLPLF